MSTDSIAKQKSMAFAIRIVRLYQYLKEEHKEYVMSKQTLRSGTSIGANIAEAVYGSSRKAANRCKRSRRNNLLAGASQ